VALGGILVDVDHPTIHDIEATSKDWLDSPHRSRPSSDTITEHASDFIDIPSRDDYRALVDAAYRKHAIDQGCARVREVEEHVITPAMRRIESADPARHLVGLAHRLKAKPRLSEKVEYDMVKKGISAAEAFANVKDAIRYTFQYPDGDYTSGVHADVDRLKSEGFELVDLRNTWPNKEYKGINSRWRVPDSGQLFEVQFHTRASFEAKQETHWAYEKLRSSQTPSAEQRELQQYQREVSARIPVPFGVTDVPNHPQETR
jgi:hypothetical protein